jgi:hypothetical protein
LEQARSRAKQRCGAQEGRRRKREVHGGDQEQQAERPATPEDEQDAHIFLPRTTGRWRILGMASMLPMTLRETST